MYIVYLSVSIVFLNPGILSKNNFYQHGTYVRVPYCHTNSDKSKLTDEIIDKCVNHPETKRPDLILTVSVSVFVPVSASSK